eukprot:7385717-Prymnesium_polylepis.1
MVREHERERSARIKLQELLHREHHMQARPHRHDPSLPWPLAHACTPPRHTHTRIQIIFVAPSCATPHPQARTQPRTFSSDPCALHLCHPLATAVVGASPVHLRPGFAARGDAPQAGAARAARARAVARRAADAVAARAGRQARGGRREPTRGGDGAGCTRRRGDGPWRAAGAGVPRDGAHH